MPASMRSVLPTLAALLLGYALMQIGNTLQGTLLSVRASIEQFSATQIGAVGSVTGPVISGFAMMASGHIGLLYVFIIAQALMAVWGAHRSLKRVSPPTEEKEQFTPEPTVPVGTQLEAS